MGRFGLGVRDGFGGWALFVILMGRTHEYSGLRALLAWSALPALLGYIPLDAGDVSDVVLESPFLP